MSSEIGQHDEVERERQERIEDFAAEDGPEWGDLYEPGSMGCHELFDRTMIAFNMVEEMILSHPACVRDPEWFGLAHQAFRALEELYEQISEQHMKDLDEEDDAGFDEETEA